MKKFVIGIAGGSASGKSTFSDNLEEALKPNSVKVFHMDSYFKKPEDRPRAAAPISGKIYMDDNHPTTMDLPKLAQDIEDYLKNGEAEILIIEGLLTLWDENILKHLDLKLFVDCRADERIVRRLKRNMTWGLTYDQISDVYLDLVRYRHDEYVEPTKWRADFILNGSNPSENTLEMITTYVKEKIKNGTTCNACKSTL